MASSADAVTPSPNAIRSLAAEATGVLLFTGKGGVGKTSIACAVAVALTDTRQRVLLISTDPASNLDEVLGVALSDSPRPVVGAPGLDALNIDPGVAAAAYRESMVGPYRGVLPDAAVASMEEQLSGACTVEIAAFNEFAGLLGDPAATAAYDTVIFDTAPTGHTLRLLTLPSAWSDFIETNTTGESCLGPLAGLSAQRGLYARTVEALADPALTTLVLVSRPEVAALKEAARSAKELRELGVCNQRLVLNGLFTAASGGDAIAVGLERRGAEALREIPEELASLPRAAVPLVPMPPVGLDGLRGLALAPQGAQSVSVTESAPSEIEGTGTLGSLVDDIAERGSGVVMTMGKGGVGKTTIAAAIAVELASRGFAVHLSTTDPAAHVIDALGDSAASLEVGRIDPETEVAAYREHVLATAGSGLDPSALAMLEEDLRSPCTEEIAVFRAFAQVVARATDRFVILDTAPTGHTLLLIDSSESYHREVSRNAGTAPSEVLELLPRLRDPGFTKVLIVTVAEATPVSEASRLQDDLERAGIVPFSWVINQSFALVETNDPLLRQRGALETRHIESVTRERARRAVIVPWMAVPPVGQGLGALMPRSGPGDARRRPGDECERTTTVSYVYYCEHCQATFEVDADPTGQLPAEVACRRCGHPNALKAFPASTMRPPAEGCAPKSGC